jgi:hypothetical protein
MEDSACVERVDCETCHVTFPKSRVQCPCCGEVPPVKQYMFHLRCSIKEITFLDTGPVIYTPMFADLGGYVSTRDVIKMVLSAKVYYVIIGITDIAKIPHPDTDMVASVITGTILTTDISFLKGKLSDKAFIDVSPKIHPSRTIPYPFDDGANLYSCLHSMFSNISDTAISRELKEDTELQRMLSVYDLGDIRISGYKPNPETIAILRGIWDKLKSITFKVPHPRYRAAITRIYQDYLLEELMDENDNTT